MPANMVKESLLVIRWALDGKMIARVWIKRETPQDIRNRIEHCVLNHRLLDAGEFADVLATAFYQWVNAVEIHLGEQIEITYNDWP